MSNWQGRKNKTRQDRIPAGKRERVQEWDRRKSWAQDNHPKNAKDWRKFRA